MSFNERIERLNKMLADAKRIVIFTGAGASTGAGLPDFRSEDGLYNKVDEEFKGTNPEDILSADCLRDDPSLFFRYLFKEMNFTNVVPSITHTQIAELEKVRHITIVTQNVDSLHQDAGSKTVHALHGTLARAYCVECGAEYNGRAAYNDGELPICPKCHAGVIRPDITLYGEGLPANALQDSFRAARAADLFIVIGSSLTVYPAAYVPDYFGGDNLVIINHDKTPQDWRASLVFREDSDKVFEAITIPRKEEK